MKLTVSTSESAEVLIGSYLECLPFASCSLALELKNQLFIGIKENQRINEIIVRL